MSTVLPLSGDELKIRAEKPLQVKIRLLGYFVRGPAQVAARSSAATSVRAAAASSATTSQAVLPLVHPTA